MAQRRTAVAAAIMMLFSVLQYALITVNASPASAHHPEITASVVCVENWTQVQFQATAWAYGGDQNRRHNNDVRVTVDGELVGSGAFTAENGYSFSGSFDAEPYFGRTIEIVAKTVVRWGENEDLASAGDRRSTFVEVGERCEEEPEPVTVLVTGDCVSDGNFARITVAIDPDGAASVALTAPDQTVRELAGDATVDGPLGTWTYTASAAGGHVLIGEREGSVEVRGCETPTTTPTTNTSEPEPPKSALGDLVWFDENENGRQDGGELEFPIQGATVSLLSPDGTVLEDRVTGPDGRYLFDELDAGNYRVRVCLQGADYTVENALGVADDVDSDVFVLGEGCGMTGLINLPAGVTDLTWDAGVIVEVKGIQVEPTTTTAPPPIEPVTVETLPFTGAETEQTVMVALGAMLAGAALLFAVSRREEAASVVDSGTSWSNQRT